MCMYKGFLSHRLPSTTSFGHRHSEKGDPRPTITKSKRRPGMKQSSFIFISAEPGTHSNKGKNGQHTYLAENNGCYSSGGNFLLLLFPADWVLQVV